MECLQKYSFCMRFLKKSFLIDLVDNRLSSKRHELLMVFQFTDAPLSLSIHVSLLFESRFDQKIARKISIVKHIKTERLFCPRNK